MDKISILLLILSILLSAGRNLFSKSISDFTFEQKNFYFLQANIFFSGVVILLILNKGIPQAIAPLTCVYAVIYGVCLLLAQWCYTAALKRGNNSICETVYALGFILPVMSGMIFWSEEITALKLLGIFCVIPAIILSSGKGKQGDIKREYNYIFPLIISMLASGGLGIMQKVQQGSPYPEQREAFVILSFLLAGAVSFLCGLKFGKKTEKLSAKKALFASCVGICFGSCNLLNTILAGRLDSTVFFPILNIGRILMSLIFGILFFKEKITKKQIFIFAFGISSILFLNN